MRQMRASLIIASLGLALGACGSSGGSSAGSSSVTTTVVASTASTMTDPAVDDADVEFAQGMIAHHEQAIEMAEIALDPKVGASPQVIDLATRIQGAQDPEVELMTGWLTAAGEPVAMDAAAGHDMSSMQGMMTAEQMDSMAAMTGFDFDQIWLQMMIEHHEGAVSQSQTVKTNGSNADVLALADTIINTQQAEIAEMQALLQG